MHLLNLGVHYIACAFFSLFFVAGVLLMGTFLVFSISDVTNIDSGLSLLNWLSAIVLFGGCTLTAIIMAVLPWAEPLPETTRPA